MTFLTGIVIGIICGVLLVLMINRIRDTLDPSIAIWRTIRHLSTTNPMLDIKIRKISNRILQWKYTNAEFGILVEKTFLFIAWWPLSNDQNAYRFNKHLNQIITKLEHQYPKVK